MRITTKGRNALKLMIDVAIYDQCAPVKIRDIASRQDISEKYLEQIVSVLNKAGIVKSIRGAKGGYVLSKKPEEYTVGQILRSIEGSLSPVEDTENDNSPAGIVSKRVWDKLETAINDVLEGLTLADLVEWYYELTMDYCI